MSRNLRSSDHDQTCSPSSTAPTASVSITAAGRQQACCISSRRSAVHRTKHTVFKSRRFRAKQLDAPSTDIDEITTDLNRIKFKKRNKRVIRADRKRQRRLIKELIHSDDTDGVHSANIKTTMPFEENEADCGESQHNIVNRGNSRGGSFRGRNRRGGRTPRGNFRGGSDDQQLNRFDNNENLAGNFQNFRGIRGCRRFQRGRNCGNRNIDSNDSNSSYNSESDDRSLGSNKISNNEEVSITEDNPIAQVDESNKVDCDILSVESYVENEDKSADESDEEDQTPVVKQKLTAKPEQSKPPNSILNKRKSSESSSSTTLQSNKKADKAASSLNKISKTKENASDSKKRSFSESNTDNDNDETSKNDKKKSKIKYGDDNLPADEKLFLKKVDAKDPKNTDLFPNAVVVRYLPITYTEKQFRELAPDADLFAYLDFKKNMVSVIINFSSNSAANAFIQRIGKKQIVPNTDEIVHAVKFFCQTVPKVHQNIDPLRIFVGNIAVESSKASLDSIFPENKSVTLIRKAKGPGYNLAFAFIEFNDPEPVKKYIAMSQKISLDGKESTTSENPASTSQDDAPKRYRHRNSAKQIASLNRSINRLGFQSPAKRRKPLFVGWICDDINRADDIKLNYKHPITQESNAQPCCSISSLYSPPSIISTSRATPVKSVLSDCIDCDANSTPRNCPKIILL
ncbi:hypothetical protein GJ496_006484 [Pomphorhynchus laevis]|nr:hypothetical protein GJ496_006484 [Pomphorhynchus laevis]